jgi:hypothetical protein
MIDRGYPKFKNTPVIEKALSEPQMIKQTMLRCFFTASHVWAQLNYLKRLGKNSPKTSARFQALVEELFMQLSMKKTLIEAPYFNDVLDKIKSGQAIPDGDLFDLLISEGKMLQELGVLKIELLRSVPPEMAYMESELLGTD